MSSITKTTLSSFLLIAALFTASGCGDSSSEGVFDTDASVHPAGWLPAGHVGPARENVSACTQCHGTELTGGISNVSCTSCHLGGPTSAHPLEWGEDILTNHGRYAVENGFAGCRNVWCHGNNLQGVQDSGPSCRECHDFP